MCSPSWNPSYLPTPYHPSGSSQCTSPEHPVSCIELGLAICFTYNIHVSLTFSQIIPASPSPTNSKRQFHTSVSLLLSHIQGYRYHLSKFHIYVFTSVQFRSVAQWCPTLCDLMNLSTPGPTVHHQFPGFTQTQVHWFSDAIQPSHPLSSPSPPAPMPPSIRVFSNESTLRIRWPKHWSFSFSIIRSKEIPELISFRMDWLDLLAVQGTLKSLLQHHSSKASILQLSAFFTVQPLSRSL